MRELIEGIEALEPGRFDDALLARMAGRGVPKRPIRFHTPSFKAYATSELAGTRGSWPAVSITGGACKLQCDHCRAKILEPMIPAMSPAALWRVATEAIASGAQGMLLSGGSNHRDEVEYGPFLPTVRRLKDAHPGFRIAIHTALVDDAMAREIAAAGVDVAMLDIIGAQDTVQQVYHLRRPVGDFEASLASLVSAGLEVVPHIVIGLHYGRLLGEWHALEMVARHHVRALVLVAAMPIYADPKRPFLAPDPAEVGAFFLDARAAMGEAPVLLGCARPAGRAKIEVDAYAVLAGLDGIAHPADGIVALAVRAGREASVMSACCSIGLDDPSVPALDARAFLARDAAPRRHALRIPVVAVHA